MTKYIGEDNWKVIVEAYDSDAGVYLILCEGGRCWTREGDDLEWKLHSTVSWCVRDGVVMIVSQGSNHVFEVSKNVQQAYENYTAGLVVT